MKRFLSVLLMFSLMLSLLSSLPLTTQAASESDLTFKLNTDGKSYLVTACDKTASGTLWIPEYYKGKPVTAIGDSAFSRCNYLEYVYIPLSVKSIGNSAFYYCTNLEGIGFGILGESINDSALQTIGDSAFYHCIALVDVKFPISVQSIGDSAFYDCTSLSSISFPNGANTTDGVKTIGNQAFRNCENLRTVTLPNCLQALGSDVFGGCTSLQYNCLENGYYLGSSNNVRFVFVRPLISNYSTVEINSNTKHIYYNAFYNYSTLTSVAIPNGVRSIGPYAFSRCSGLESISIPDSVTNIGNYAFQQCTNLTSVTIGNGVEMIGAGAFGSCSRLSHVDFGESVTSVGQSAFSGCQYLYSVHITDLAAWCQINFTNEAANPMWQYSSRLYLNGEEITHLVIPDGVTEIGCYAFPNCTHFESVTIPDSVTNIGTEAFRYCNSLTYVTMGNGVETIGESAFESCSKLKSVWYRGTAHEQSLISIDYGNNKLINATWHYNFCTGEHIYSSTCDAECNACGFPRETTLAHTYVSDCADTCILCSYVRIPILSHVYDSMCDTECVFCGAQRIAPHRYSGICDPKCIDCGFIRTGTAEHTYTNACDVNCDICLAMRRAPHDYDGDCDTQCNSCGITRTGTADHIYTNDCDIDCDVCGVKRTINHDYAVATCEMPATCRICGITIGFKLGHEFTNYVSDHNATCLEDGTKTAKCNRCEMTDTVKDENSKTGHNYTITPEFCWADDYETCSAIFACINECGEDRIVLCTITADFSNPRQTVYTAKASIEGVSYTDTVIITNAYISGDLDGDFEITDWDGVLLARYLAGWTVEVANISAMDIDGDGEVTDWDGVVLDRYLAGWNVTIG